MSAAVTYARHAVWCRNQCAPAASSAGLLIAWCIVNALGNTACAQSITAAAPQTITHNRSDAPQIFSEVAWQLLSGLDELGYTAQWSCGPFQHTDQGTLRADSKLEIRVLASGGSANWTVVASGDQTDYAGGDQTATVAAQSSAIGDGEVGLTVTFVNLDFSTLAAGNYTMTVTGTLTAN